MPPGIRFDTAVSQARLTDEAARTLCGLTVTIAAIAIVVAAVETISLGFKPLGEARFVLGATLAATAVLGHALLRRARSATAAKLIVVMLSVAISYHAWAIGLGLFSIGLAGVGLLVAVTGRLFGMTAALALFALHLLVVFALAYAEAMGWIGGREALANLGVPQRIAGHVLIGLAGLAAAWMLHRVGARLIGEALADRERLAALLGVDADWTWQADSRGNLTFLSPSFERSTGRTVHEFLRRRQADGPKAVPDAQLAALRRDMLAKRPYRDRVITFRCADGATLVVRSNGAPQFDAAGSLTHWIGVCRNVTQERLAEQESGRVQALLDRIVQTSPDPICVARLDDGRILLANPVFERLSGGHDVRGRSAVEIGLWSSVDEAVRMREAVRAGGGVVRDWRTHVRLAGQPERVMLLSAAAFDWHGDHVAVILTRDVTEVERLRIQTDAILDNASVGIALVLERRFERVNPTLELMFGHPAGSLQGRPVDIVFPDRATFDDFASSVQAVLQLRQAVDIERRVTRKDGRRIVVRLRARAIDPKQPTAGGSIWVVEDVTELRRAERDLAQAKRHAESASSAKSVFLATMSHEIRTPLNAVLGLAHLLQDEAIESPVRRQYLGHLVEAAQHLADLVSDVLDLSKIEAGHLRLEELTFDLHEVVNACFQTFAPIGREHGLRMDCWIDPQVPRHVRGDPVRLRQILSNFISNSIKFTVEGQVLVRLQHVRAARIRLAVQDSGPGISAQLRTRLFQPFEQADDRTNQRAGGTGLGLSICRQLAMAMSGEVGVESDGEHGSEFWAELELASADAVDGVEATSEAGVALAGLVALVAEDNPVNMLILAAMLRRLGVEVIEAEDGALAVEFALKIAARLDVVLMDLHMPGLDGLAATRALRADPRTARLPVLAITAATLEHERRAAEAAGMDGFIAKPIDEAELLRALLRIRQQQPSGARR